MRLYDGTPAEAQATRQVLAYVLERSLRLLHPFMPFVTETIWQNLPGLAEANHALIVARWPYAEGRRNEADEDMFGRMQEIVRAIRNVRSEYNVEPSRRIAAEFSAGDYAQSLRNNLSEIVSLARLDPTSVSVAAELPAPDKAVTLAVGGFTVYLPLAGLVDLDAERSRLQNEIANMEQLLARSNNLLGNPGFMGKAPAEVIQRERAKVDELELRKGQLTERLGQL